MAESTACGKASFPSIIEAVHYHYAPYLHRQGAHVWIEEVSSRSFVLGFSAWSPERGALWRWLHDELRQLVRPSVFEALTVKDYSDFRPALSSAGRTAVC